MLAQWPSLNGTSVDNGQGVHGSTYEVANKHDVGELKSTNDDQEQHECVKQLCALCGLLDVAVPYSLHDVLRVVGGLGFDGRVGRARDGLGVSCALLGRHCEVWAIRSVRSATMEQVVLLVLSLTDARSSSQRPLKPPASRQGT